MLKEPWNWQVGMSSWASRWHSASDAQTPALSRALHIHAASWLNQVEIWFGVITRQASRRGSFKTVRELIQRTTAPVERYNRTSQPFTWTATADSILAKLPRPAKAIAGTQH